ncbi:MAG TPA: S24/S26 family peptidase [Burkholderiales bacterium]|nr:S24/S26 family peptidase [Burkholderiales bacterium]
MADRGRFVREHGEIDVPGLSLAEIMREVLAKGRPFRFRARGLSMSPFIKDGDVVTVSPLEDAAPRTGDVLAFLHPTTGKVVVHRIVRQSPGSYDLKGDNAAESDGSLPAGRVLGIVTRVERDGAAVRLGRKSGAVVAQLSRTGLLRKAVGAARRTGLRNRGRR